MALAGIDLRIEAGRVRRPRRPLGLGQEHAAARRAAGSSRTSTAARSPGAITVGGRSTRTTGPAELATSVGFVAQEPETQVVSTTVRAELELPLELRGAGAGGDRPGGRGDGARARRSSRCSTAPPTRCPAASCSASRSAPRSSPGPPLLLLDEPTSQLDPVAGDELIALLRRLNEEWGVTVLLGEHRLERCLAAADRVVALDGGRVLYDGSPRRLRRERRSGRRPSSRRR